MVNSMMDNVNGLPYSVLMGNKSLNSGDLFENSVSLLVHFNKSYWSKLETDANIIFKPFTYAKKSEY